MLQCNTKTNQQKVHSHYKLTILPNLVLCIFILPHFYFNDKIMPKTIVAAFVELFKMCHLLGYLFVEHFLGYLSVKVLSEKTTAYLGSRQHSNSLGFGTEPMC